MHKHPLATAVLVFVRDEHEEAQLKFFHRRLGLRERLQVVRAFNKHIAAVTSRSGLPVYLVKGAQQVGGSFGERFANAIETVFAAGYEKVITVGNDCLSLTSKHLKRIATLLEQGTPMVLGPAKDGGVYTIGLYRTVYRRDLFINLPWQTGQLLASLINYTQQQKADCYCLAQATDVDDETSFQYALSHLSTKNYIYSVLKNILHCVDIQSITDIPVLSAKFSSLALLRAPPIRL